ncbi:hypothetical protein MK139_07520 [bacterium]|jgi:16S rRNA (guanine(1405)-N(7))-methyltransferase|nr:hypothetical protein [bacterium]
MLDVRQVEDRIRSSRKYGDLHPSVVRRQVAELENRYRSEKQLEQAVRRKLHQAFGAYLHGNWLRKFRTELQRIDPEDDDSILQGCHRLMLLHTSTRERTSILGRFLEWIAGIVPEGASVLDVACGLNALVLPALYKSRRFRYTGVDLHREISAQLSAFAAYARVEAKFVWGDILDGNLPRCDVAWIFKLLPVLEHQEKGSATRLIRDLEAEVAIASFPTRSLGGADVGMEYAYHRQIEEICGETGRSFERFDCETERFYVMR